MQNEPILAMLVGPAFGWANRARRSRFGFDEATARWAGPCPAWAGRAFCFCSSRFASTRIQVHLFLPDLARLSCPFFSLLVCVSCSMLPMFLPSLPIPFSLPTIPSFPNIVALSSFPQTSLPVPLVVSSTASCPQGCFETEKLHAQQRSPAFSQIQTAQKFCFQVPSVHDLHR